MQEKKAGQAMAKQPKSSQPPHGEGPSRHKGTHQHGWSPDVDETRRQDNPSAHRSFHPDQHAPDRGPGRKVSKEEAGNPHGRPVKSTSDRGEEQSKARSDERACTTPAPRAAPSAPAEPGTHPPPPASTLKTRRTRPAAAGPADLRAPSLVELSSRRDVTANRSSDRRPDGAGRPSGLLWLQRPLHLLVHR